MGSLESDTTEQLHQAQVRGCPFCAVAPHMTLSSHRLAFSHISSDSFLCDCQLKWLPPWLLGRTLQSFVTATCAHPEALKGQSIFSVPPESFVCGKTVFAIWCFSFSPRARRPGETSLQEGLLCKHTEVVCHSLLQWTTFCQTSLL